MHIKRAARQAYSKSVQISSHKEPYSLDVVGNKPLFARIVAVDELLCVTRNSWLRGTESDEGRP
jgi:hypothetical protein